MARGRHGFQARGPRRVTEWGAGPLDAGGSLSATGKTLWSSSVSLASGSGTIIRTRGAGRFLLKTAAAAGDGFLIAVGLGLFTSDALAAGVASLPGPQSDIDWDGWFWHQVAVVQSVTATIADGVNAASATFQYEVDSKAMRKWDQGAMILAGVIEVTELGTASMEHNADTRILLKS